MSSGRGDRNIFPFNLFPRNDPRFCTGICPISKVQALPSRWAFGRLSNRNKLPDSIKVREGQSAKNEDSPSKKKIISAILNNENFE
jgi:hypothetical protein